MEEQKKKRQDSKKQRKIRRHLTENYQGNTWQNYYMDGGK